MSQGRARVQMSKTETTEFLAAQTKVQIATIGRDNVPHLTTLFYAWLEQRIMFWTYGSSQKVHNLRRDPRMAALVEAGEEYLELRGVSITGHAEIIDDYEGVLCIGQAVAAVMPGVGDLGDAGEEHLKAQARKRVGIIVEPEHIATWDHAKLLA